MTVRVRRTPPEVGPNGAPSAAPAALPVRRASGQARRPKRPKRASAGLSSLRAAALLVMLLAALGVYGATASAAFAFRTLEIEGAGSHVVPDAAIRQRLGLDEGAANLFLVATDRLDSALRGLPSVIRAEVSIRLPGTVRVRIVEREPILAWAVGETRFLVDREGMLFAASTVGDTAPGAGLPTVVDGRIAAAALAVGDRLDPIDLDAATRLGSLRPIDVGSAAIRLALRVDDAEGYTVRPVKGPWLAVFGFYTPSLRTPAMIPGQVQALRSLLLDRGEATVKRAVLATERGGTYQPAATPGPSPSGKGTP